MVRWFLIGGPREGCIIPDDIFNFDKIGFVIGLTTTAKIITRTGILRLEAVLLVSKWQVCDKVIEAINAAS